MPGKPNSKSNLLPNVKPEFFESPHAWEVESFTESPKKYKKKSPTRNKQKKLTNQPNQKSPSIADRLGPKSRIAEGTTPIAPKHRIIKLPKQLKQPKNQPGSVSNGSTSPSTADLKPKKSLFDDIGDWADLDGADDDFDFSTMPQWS